MIRLLEQFFRLLPGDLGRGLLLSVYLFFIITSYILGKVVRDSLFLDQFNANLLPLADIAVAVLVGFVIAPYVRLARRVQLRDLVLASLVAFIGIAIALWWIAGQGNRPWVYPAIYIFVGIYGVLAPAQVWTLANYVMTTREAKRIFGLLGSGAIAGGIFGGYFARFAAETFGPESLLLWMSLMLCACTAVVVLIWRRKLEDGQAPSPASRPPDQISRTAAGFLESFRLVRSSAYLQAIAAVICLSSFVTTFAGWQLKALAAAELVEKTSLAIFFGNFYFVAGILALATQLLLTSRILRRFGIGPALIILPIAMMIGTFGVLIWGTLFAATVLKGSDQVLRYSVDKSTVELLYLPVSSQIKVQVKSFIDTVVWRFGDGLSGLALLFFATILGWSPQDVSWINLLLILCWLTTAGIARRQYVATLQQSIREHRLDAERTSAPVLDRSTADIISHNLAAAEPQEILYVLGLFEVSPEIPSSLNIQELLQHPYPVIRCKTIAVLSVAGDKTAIPAIQPLVHDPDFAVRSEAMLFLAHHSDFDPLAHIDELSRFPDFSIQAAIITFLTRQGPSQASRMMFRNMIHDSSETNRRTRIEAARLLGMLPDVFKDETRRLLNDPDPGVVQQTILSIGKLQNRDWIPTLMELLEEAEVAEVAQEALVCFGSAAVLPLSEQLTKAGNSTFVRQKMASLLAQIATPDAIQTLQKGIIESDTLVRFRIIAGLNKLHQNHTDVPLNRLMVENLVEAEIVGHYRSYQVMSVLEQHVKDEPKLSHYLSKSLEADLERIFRLLSLLMPNQDLHSAYVGLQSSNALIHDNALEFFEHVMKPEIRNLLVPVLDGEVSREKRFERADRLIGARVESVEEAVQILVRSKDPWLKAAAAAAIGILRLTTEETSLDMFLEEDDPTLRDEARQAKLRL